MVEAKMNMWGPLKKFFLAISNVANEAAVEFKTDSIRVKALDPSFVALVDGKFNTFTLSEYMIDNDVTVGLNFDNLSRVLKLIKDKQPGYLRLEESYVELGVERVGGYQRFRLPIMDVSVPDTQADKLQYTEATIFSVGLEELLDAVKAAEKSKITSVVFDLSGGKLKIKGESSGLGEIETELNVGVEKSARAKFSVPYLKMLLSPLPRNAELTLTLETDKPLKMEAKTEEFELSMWLAPMIEG